MSARSVRDAVPDWVSTVRDGVPTPVLWCVLACVLTVLVASGTLIARRPGRVRDTSSGMSGTRPRDGRTVEMLLTLAAAGIATGVAVNGMWRVFGDALGFTGPGRFALAGFLEIALMVSAIRARRNLRESGTVGLDGAAVWAMAALSAVLSASDAHGLGRGVRFAAPLVAAWLWERGMASDRRAARPVLQREAVAWRWTRARMAVRFGLADPAQRETTDVDRARRLARLTRARLRLAILETSTVPVAVAWLTVRPVRRAVAAWRLQRHALAAVEHLHLGTDPTVTATITTTVAAVVGMRDATTPGRLALSDPWAGQDGPRPPAVAQAEVHPLRMVPPPSATKRPTPASRPGGGQKRLDVSRLLQAGRDLARDMAGQGKTVTWSALHEALKDSPGCSTREAKELRRILAEDDDVNDVEEA